MFAITDGRHYVSGVNDSGILSWTKDARALLFVSKEEAEQWWIANVPTWPALGTTSADRAVDVGPVGEDGCDSILLYRASDHTELAREVPIRAPSGKGFVTGRRISQEVHVASAATKNGLVRVAERDGCWLLSSGEDGILAYVS